MHDNTIKQETFTTKGVCKVSEKTTPEQESVKKLLSVKKLQMILSYNINYEKRKAT